MLEEVRSTPGLKTTSTPSGAVTYIAFAHRYGEVVRTFSGWDAPPLRMTWDGLDDAGRLVADGDYNYDIVVVDQHNRPLSFSGSLTQVRTAGPTGRLEVRPQH